MVLDYLSLGMLFFVAIVLFYGIIAIGEGQMQPMADFLRYNQQTIPGRVAVAIEITDPRLDEYRLPGGLFGQAAIYTEHFHHIGLIRKVLLRMAAWMNYVFPLH